VIKFNIDHSTNAESSETVKRSNSVDYVD